MCIFCEIVCAEAEVTKVYEDDVILAFLDIRPINPGHTLVIPKQHAELITELDEATVDRLFRVSQKINRILRSELGAAGANYFLADGESAGQEVPHVHIHVFPRYPHDGFGFTFPEGYDKLPSRTELDEVGRRIEAAWGIGAGSPSHD